MEASSKPSKSGMHTSMRINATSFLSKIWNASRAEAALRRFSPIWASTTSWLSSFACWSSTNRMFTFSEGLMVAAPLAMQPHAQRRHQLLYVHRLGQIVGCAGLQALFAIALHG